MACTVGVAGKLLLKCTNTAIILPKFVQLPLFTVTTTAGEEIQ